MILIADDNPLMRKTIRSLVEDLDPEIVECADGVAACFLYQVHRPDWVLMDVMMHPKNGLIATKEIVQRFPSARIVVITQQSDAETRREALNSGACEFFGKEDLRPIRALLSGTRSDNDPRN